MTPRARLLQLLQEWADAMAIGDRDRALVAAREAVAIHSEPGTPGLGDLLELMEQLSTNSGDPEVLRLQEEATEASACDFCQRGYSDVHRLVAGGRGHICGECAVICEAELSERSAASASIRVARVGEGGGQCTFCGARGTNCVAGVSAVICEGCIRRIKSVVGAAPHT